MADYIIHVGVTTNAGTANSLADQIVDDIEMNYDDITDFDVWYERSDGKGASS